MKRQAGISLIEVLVAMLVMTLALLGAAALQLNSLKYTDSARLRTQASFIAYDMMERIRANSSGNYVLANLDSAPADPSTTDVRLQDLFDFGENVTNMGGTDASIALLNSVYTITITWDDARAGNMVTANNSEGSGILSQTFTLTSRVAAPATSATTTP
ncbi:type IV pilus modification protein PilV [Pseudomonas japonica]|uniref:type IV pilus modification protein PilV n=1 Tax=Pseudomonas japonica TaxID=256466 RepID=UPI0015E36A6C|nr:type IV pilus modification protein PilV [Pseudomonas japonica]MBA1288230.1 type IV pilus modification protein PilV [Pseudomonas japonica]